MVNATRLLHFSQQFHRFYDNQFTALLAETNLSMREMHVLLFLINNPDYDTARDVTVYRGLAKSQVSQAVELLCGQDYLVRRADASDRRVVHLQLTEKGHLLAQRAQKRQSDCYEQLFRGFTAEEVAQFHQLLERLLDNSDTLYLTACPCGGSN